VSPARTGVKRLDRAAARAYYVALEPAERSFPAVAAKFGVSDTTVRKWARREGWDDSAREADRKAAAAGLAQAERTREQRAVQTARMRDLAADSIEGQFVVDEEGNVTSTLEPAVRVQVWKEADRQYRLDIGEVTDRISIPEVREFVLQLAGAVDELLVAVLDEQLGNGKRQVVLRAFRARFPEVLELAAGQVSERTPA
jgi:hypothetical protein